MHLVDAPGTTRRPLAAVAAVLLPLLFLHVSFQPTLTVRGATASLSDLAVLAIVLLAATAARSGMGVLAPARVVWIAAFAFFLWLAVSIVIAEAREGWYPFGTHLTTGAKYLEYALLAPAVALVFRTAESVSWLVAAVAGWSAVASAVGLAQFFGAGIADGWGAGRRQPSFLGQHDFGSLSGAALSTALVVLAFYPAERRFRAPGWIAAAAGIVGVVLAGALYVLAGIIAAAAVIATVAVSRRQLSGRRFGLGAFAVATVVVGSVAMRSGDISNFASFAGNNGRQSSSARVQTYAQRTLLAYIGLRIFVDHPFFGVGWQASADAPAYRPYLGAAHRRFRTTPELAFPAPQHPYGVQNAYVQAAADMGAPGLLLLALAVLVPVVVGTRVALGSAGPPAAVAVLGVALTLVAAGALGGLGLIAGIPTDALLWIGIGLVAVATGWARAEV